MKVPLQVSFRNMEPRAELEEIVRERAAQLDRFARRVTSCQVVIDCPHRHQKNGNQYHVRIDLPVRDGVIVVNREPTERLEHQNLALAIHDAFDAARRQLDEYVESRRDEVRNPRRE